MDKFDGIGFLMERNGNVQMQNKKVLQNLSLNGMVFGEEMSF